MAKNYGLDGLAASVELSKGGARVKNNSGVIEARNNADSSLAVVRGADAVGSTDLVTKSQLDAVDTGTVKAVRAAFAHDTSTPFNIGSAVPANAEVIKVNVAVTTAFDGTTPTLSVGDAGDVARLMATDENDLATIGMYTVDLFNAYGSSTQLTGTLTLSGATAGAGVVIIQYVEV